MSAQDLLRELEELGTDQNRKVYRRHGVGENQFGVAFGKLRPLAKRVKTDHAAAVELWASGNHDARILAAMIADPAQADDILLDVWVEDLDNYVLTDAFASFAAKTPSARAKLAAWTASAKEWVSSAGWNLVCSLAENELDKATCTALLERIEREIHQAPNRTRYAMNNALITLGIQGGELEKLAKAAAERIGKVEVDHGETGCKTPDAAPYIDKTLAYRRRKKAERDKREAARETAKRIEAAKK